MNVLVIGSGGREHALVWKLAQGSSVRRVLWAPGNPAARVDAKVKIREVKDGDIHGLADLAEKEKIDLTVVGPEAPLVAGIADEFRRRGLAIFGPSRKGAQLEGSKVFAKQFFLKYKIPTGQAAIFSKIREALTFSHRQPKPLVIKADGLAAGKGVVICANDGEVERALREIMEQKVFGESGNQVLIEECLSGREVSVHAITDGQTYQLLASAQDHKRALDNDHGSNTGGMGAYSPAPLFTSELETRVRTEIFDRTIAGLQAEGIPYCGVLYAGLMLTADGPKILEYNCRLGDPETQVILPRLKNDLAEVLVAACLGGLKSISLQWNPDPAVCIILAAGGYPASYRKGDIISGLEQAARGEGVHLFHAGTSLQGNNVITTGGRVLGVAAIAPTLRQAVEQGYRAADMTAFEGKHCRRDIAARIE